jgi:hypothetical protein
MMKEWRNGSGRRSNKETASFFADGNKSVLITFVDQGLQGAGRSRPHLRNAIITIFTVAETAASTTYNKFILADFGISVISALIFSRPRTDTVDFRTTPFPELLPIRILV